MEDVHEREVRQGQQGAISLNAPLTKKTYSFIGFDHEDGAVYYRFRNQHYRCTAYLGSLKHEPVDEEEVRSVSAGSMKWIFIDPKPSYDQEEAYAIIQRHLTYDVARWDPPKKQEKGWFKSFLEAIFG